MAEKLADLYVPIIADGQAFLNSLKQTEKIAKTEGEKIGNTFSSRFSSSFGKIAVGIGASLSVGAVVAYTKSTLAMADGLAKTADKLGLSTDQLQIYRYAAGQANIEQGNLDNSMKFFLRSIAEASEGVKEYTDNFDKLGVTVTDKNGKIRDSKDILIDVAEGLGRTENQAIKTSVAMGIFGRSGADMLNLLGEGSGELRDAANRLRDLGGILEDPLLRSAEKVNDSFDDLNHAFGAGFYRGILQSAEGLLMISNNSKDFAKNMGTVAESIGSATSKLVNFLATTIETIGAIKQIQTMAGNEQEDKVLSDLAKGKKVKHSDLSFLGMEQANALISEGKLSKMDSEGMQSPTSAGQKWASDRLQELRGNEADEIAKNTEARIKNIETIAKQTEAVLNQNDKTTETVKEAKSKSDSSTGDTLKGSIGASMFDYNQGIARSRRSMEDRVTSLRRTYGGTPTAPGPDKNGQIGPYDFRYAQEHGGIDPNWSDRFSRKDSGAPVHNAQFDMSARQTVINQNIQYQTLTNPQEAARLASTQSAMQGGRL